MVPNFWKPFMCMVKSSARVWTKQFIKSDEHVPRASGASGKNKDIRKRYKISSKSIGQGQFGDVYLGTDTLTGESVAVKRVIRYRAKLADLLGEVDVLQDISHPHIIKAHNLFRSKIYWNIVLELAEGMSLYQWITAKETFSINRELLTAHSIIDAIDCLHSSDIVHGDLKPQNVMISASRDKIIVKVIDFGSAYRLCDKYSRPHDFTPAYAAPELLRMDGIGKPSDIWACGLMCYMLIESHHPFDKHSKENVKDIECRILNDDPQYSDVWDLVHPEFSEAVKKALCKDCNRRPTAVELSRANWTLKD